MPIYDRTQQAYDTLQIDALFPTLKRDVPALAGAQPGSPTTYYGRPMLQPPTWSWYIPTYFWLGGIGGGAAVVGAAAELIGGDKHRATVRHARWLSLAVAAVCPIPLILDLGRPARFFRMLRVIKVTSPLNLGTWILTAFGLVSGLLAARQAAEDNFMVQRDSTPGRLARIIPSGPLTVLHAALGVALGGYTGTLLTITAVPIWAAAGVILGPLFLATSLASGAAALTIIGLITGLDTAQTREQVENVESLSALVQMSAVVAREVLVPHVIYKPLREGLWGGVYRFGAVGAGMVAPTALRLAVKLSGRRVGTAISATAATLALLGALVERFAITEAGKRSAADPLAYQALTKGAPGEARATPKQQAQRAPQSQAFGPGVSVSDWVG